MSTHDKQVDDRRYHNAPESGGLSSSELATVEAGRTAMQSLRKTFDLWVAVGRAVHTLRLKADRLQGRQTFKRLMAQQGFKMDGPQSERQLDKATVTRLIQIIENLAAVTAWHEGLTDKQKIDWAGPSAIFKHCPVFAKPKNTPTKLTEREQLKQSVTQLEEENHRLKKQREDERWTPTDTAENVAACIVGMFTPSKAVDIARRILARIEPKATSDVRRK
jgi:hypothetical protein